MKRFTSSIRKSIDTKNWYGALMTALTLPDICGKLETPNENSKARSVRWLRTWIEPHYTDDELNHVFLSAEDCYALRCSFLHEGALISRNNEQDKHWRISTLLFLVLIGISIAIKLIMRCSCKSMCSAINLLMRSISGLIQWLQMKSFKSVCAL